MVKYGCIWRRQYHKWAKWWSHVTKVSWNVFHSFLDKNVSLGGHDFGRSHTRLCQRHFLGKIAVPQSHLRAINGETDSKNASDALPTVRRCHVTAGVAKQAKTSSVQLKCVTCGLVTTWPRHWPHISTCPLCVLAADVWLVWHAATSTILWGSRQYSAALRLEFKN